MLVIAPFIFIIIYILLGIISENVFLINRFDLQGNLFIGTSAAATVIIISTILLVGSNNNYIFIFNILLIITGLYYQSRILQIFSLGFILIQIFNYKFWQFLVLILFYFTLIIFSPWHVTGNLNPARIQDIFFSEFMSKPQTSITTAKMKVNRFIKSTIPFAPEFSADEIRVGNIHNTSPSAQKSPGFSADEIRVGNIHNTSPSAQKSPDNGLTVNYGASNSQDQDRKIVLLSAIKFLISDDAARFFFGGGVNSYHRNLLNFLKQEELNYNFRMPANFHKHIQASTTIGYLADIGFIGIILWFLIFLVVAISILRNRSNAHTLLYILFFLFLSTLISQNYLIPLLFLAIAPNSLLAKASIVK